MMKTASDVLILKIFHFPKHTKERKNVFLLFNISNVFYFYLINSCIVKCGVKVKNGTHKIVLTITAI